ncbi:MAG TPA: hypothetical protein VK929_09885 [Longimicrobiales bacterium]|nr:hypothetical protein [Longimicrobiales bacterium]
MDQIQAWWASVLRSLLHVMSAAWTNFTRGVTGEWDISYFILFMAMVLILGLVGIWRRAP